MFDWLVRSENRRRPPPWNLHLDQILLFMEPENPPPNLVNNPESKSDNSRGTSSGRRAAYISVNHLLNFEVGSGSNATSGSFSGSTNRRLHKGPKPGADFTKERFIHAKYAFLQHLFHVLMFFSFRFVAREDAVINKEIFLSDPDAQLEWNDIELVIVPAQHDVICPICLDTPKVPRLTKCGHFFCWPCVLRYASATSVAGSGNWRKCPICFENINTKQLKSVFFDQVQDYSVQSSELSEIGIRMTLLTVSGGSCIVYPVEPTAFTSSDGQNLNDLSPFQRISFVSPTFVINNIVDVELNSLRNIIAGSFDDDEELSFLELAFAMLDDRLSAIVESSSPPINNQISPPSTAAKNAIIPMFFHQSSDGQPYFLCPLTIKMLRSQFGSYEKFPPLICAPILEIEMAVITEELRKRYKHLRHLPIGCQFGLCELDLRGMVSAEVLKEFESELELRSSVRKSKAAKEERMAAEAFKRQLHSYCVEDEIAERSYSPSLPGIASGIFGCGNFLEDFENFPTFPSPEPDHAIRSIPIEKKPAKANSNSLAGSFASIAAASPPSDGSFVVVPPPNALSSETLFDMSTDDLPSAVVGGKKGKRIVLVSNAHPRRS